MTHTHNKNESTLGFTNGHSGTSARFIFFTYKKKKLIHTISTPSKGFVSTPLQV